MTGEGRFILSFDFELGWGVVENGEWREREAAGVYRTLRPAIARLLRLLDELEIPVTWATVGGMLAKRSVGEFDHLPGDLRSRYVDFATNAERETIDASDLFEMIVGARINHYVASHSYSHARFSYPGYSLDGKIHDVAMAKKTMRDVGQFVDSFVFPLNHSTDFEPLAANGFRTGRVSPVENRFGRLRALNKAYYRTVALPPVAHERLNGTGVIEHFGSMLFLWPQGRLSDLRRRFVVARARKGLEHVANEGGVLHIWLHPFDLTYTRGVHDALESLLHEVSKRRDQGSIKLVSM